jgi:adenylate kinase family enzyme
MKRVAIFGNAGGGKSTLAMRLTGITGPPLHSLCENWGQSTVFSNIRNNWDPTSNFLVRR